MSLNTEPRTTPPIPGEPRPPTKVPDEPYYRRGEQGRRWGAFLVLFGVVWLVFELTTRGSLFGLGLGLVERTQAVPPQVYSAERVVVTGVSDEVEIVGWNEEGIGVEVLERGFGWNGDAAQAALDRMEVVVEEQGETLRVEVRRPPSLGAFLGSAPYAEIRIALPASAGAEATLVSGDIAVSEVDGELRLGTVSGSIEVRDSTGELTASTTSGDLEVRDYAGLVRAESVSGDIRLDGGAEGARVETVSGDVRVEGARGPVELRSISGNLSLSDAEQTSLTLVSTSGDVDVEAALAPRSSNTIDSISGNVQVRLAELRDLRLEATTASGELRSDLERGERGEERRRLSITVGEGETGLNINTTSGDVMVTED